MKGKELVKLFQKNGWELDRISGSHHIMTKEGKTLSIPVHNTDLKTGTLNKLLKDAELK